MADVLYHYTSHSGLIGIAESKSIWATSIRHLNDATEYNYAHQLVMRALMLEASRVQTKNVGEFARRMAIDIDTGKMELAQVLSSRYGQNFVTSFSEEGDLLSQWRAYCPAGGYSIGFRRASLEVVASQHNLDLVKCEYDAAVHEQQAASIAQRAVREIALLPQSVLDADYFSEDESVVPVLQQAWPIRATITDELDRIATRWKHPSFMEEREWRLVSRAHDRQISYRPGRRSIVPYIHINLAAGANLRDESCTAARTVTCGPCPEPDLSLSTAMLMCQQNKLAVTSYGWSRVPYREW